MVLPPSKAEYLGFVPYFPVRRTVLCANRSQPRRPADGGHDDSSDALPRSSRSLSDSNRHSQNRRQHHQRHQPRPPVASSTSDLFGLPDDANEDDQDISALAQHRTGRPSSRRKEEFEAPKKVDEDNFLEEGSRNAVYDDPGDFNEDILLEDDGDHESETPDIDDNVDGGFFSRYRKETDPRQRVADYSSLDAEEDKSSDALKESQGESKKRVDRETAAANAFDAVDKLFDSINLGKQGIMRKGVNPKNQKARGAKDSGRRHTGQIDRAKWLEDVKARASTKGDRVTLGGEESEDSLAVDVNAIDDTSVDGDMSAQLDAGRNEAGFVTGGDFEEAEIGDGTKSGTFAPRTSGFDSQGGAFRESGSNKGPSNISNRADRTRNEQQPGGGTPFQKLMAIAREGPNASPSVRWKQSRSTKPGVARSQASRNGTPMRRRETEEKRNKPRESQNDAREDPSIANISRLLGLTKQIVSRQADASQDKEDDSYEPLDDEMEQTIVIEGSAIKKTSSKRQKFTAVRRIANRSFKIHAPPDEWKPMTEEDIAKVQSDGRSIAGHSGGFKGKGIVADCQSCRGTGLDTCSACLGSGWVPPLDKTVATESRKALLEKIWNRPNLCVNNYGEAQCIVCNGIGKEFCETCKGSGSAVKKGFSAEEGRELFDLDDPDDDDSLLEEEDYADNDDNDFEEFDEDEEEEFQLYTGPEKPFNIHGTSLPFNNGIGERGETGDELTIGDDDDLEVVDESAELLATLEAMHLSDLEERGSDYMRRRRRSDVDLGAGRHDGESEFDLDMESEDLVTDNEDSIENDLNNMAGLDDDDDDDDLDDDLDDDDDDLDVVGESLRRDEGEELEDDLEDDQTADIVNRDLELTIDDVSEDDDEYLSQPDDELQ